MIKQVELFEPLNSKEESGPWEKHTLGSFLTPISRSVSKPDKEFLGLGIRSHGKGTFLKPNSDPDKISMKTLYQVKENDLIVNITFAWEGAVAIVESEDHGALVSHRFPTYKFETDLVIPEFFKYVIIQDRFKYLLGIISPGGAGRNRVLNKTDFLKLEVEVPPLPDQKKIARILGTWDRAIDLTERLIEAKEKQKKGLMQQLLMGKVRFREFVQSDKMQQSKVGLIPEDWDLKRGDELAAVNPRKEIVDNENLPVSFIPMASVSENARIVGTHIEPYSKVSKGFTSFKDGDVIIAKITPCFENGKGALADNLNNGLGFGSTEFHIMRTKFNVSPHFLFFHTLSYPFRKRGEANMTGSAGQKRVPTDFIKAYQIPLPSLPEQRKIATVLSACDREIEFLSKKVDVLKEQKKGLMQQLLTGKVRVEKLDSCAIVHDESY